VLAVWDWRRSVGSTGRRRRPFMAVVQCHPTWRWAAGSSELIGDLSTQRTLDRPDHHCAVSECACEGYSVRRFRTAGPVPGDAQRCIVGDRTGQPHGANLVGRDAGRDGATPRTRPGPRRLLLAGELW
jgi:hypothetical protein